MLNIDDLLMVLQNPTRRRILELLSQETHYPLQISRELGISPQSVMKHLKVLEEHGLVRSFEESSDSGGPPRKYYAPIKGFSIRIDAGPGLFDTIIIERKGGKRADRSRSRGQHPELKENAGRGDTDSGNTGRGDTDSGNAGRGDTDSGNTGRGNAEREAGIEKLKELSCEIKRLENEIERIEKNRLQLLNQRERLLESAREIVIDMIPDYMERRLIYYLLEEGPTSMEDISEVFDRRIKSLRALQREIERRYGLNWLFED